jgi:hypothetical protein
MVTWLFLLEERRGKMRKALIATGVILLVLVATSLQSFASEICVCIDRDLCITPS